VALRSVDELAVRWHDLRSFLNMRQVKCPRCTRVGLAVMDREIRQRVEVIRFTCGGCGETWKPRHRTLDAVRRRMLKYRTANARKRA
jgi:transposase-like protein